MILQSFLFKAARFPIWVAAALLLLFGNATAATRALQDISYSVLPGNRVELRLQMSEPAPEPGTFTIDSPARIAIDLPETEVALDERFMELDAAPARSVRVVEANGRTRVVLALTHLVPYELNRDGDSVVVTVGGEAAQTEGSGSGMLEDRNPGGAKVHALQGIDFRRGKEGQGKIVVTLDPGSIVDMQERGGDIIINFLDAEVPDRLERRLNVTDFATPVTTIDTYNTDRGVRMTVDAEPPFEHLAYQTGGTYTLEVKPVEQTDSTPRAGGEDGGYTGERLSLNFQNIEVRAVLQLIADFTGLNIVASDTVQGQITLRLKNVPWDQALDIILKSKGLGMRQSGNVVLIAPNEELAAREKQELEAQQQLEVLAPLQTQYFQINYAKAEDISQLLEDGEDSILSPRGSVSIDGRTNTLIVRETAEQLENFARMIEKLDVPIRQVLIESRIVVANDDFSRDLGVRFGYQGWEFGPDGTDLTSGSVEGTSSLWDTIDPSTGAAVPGDIAAPSDRLNVDLAAPGAAGQLAVAFITGDYLVDLELSALQTEGKGEVISNPRVVTSNQQEATIKQGVEIPYQEASASGATSTSFKEAVLALSVTPQITPDDHIIMDLAVSKDSQGQTVGGIPTINTRAVQTQVLVNNGDTVVLGGIYEQTTFNDVEKVPFFGDLPVLGHLFKRTNKRDNKAELLIFVTPKILREELNPGFD